MGYFLFILVNATLFVRPAEIVPEVEAWPIYQVLILGCLAVSIDPVSRQLSSRVLIQHPLHMAVLGMWLAIGLSHLSHFNLWSTRFAVVEFSKVVIYYFLLVALITTPKRLRSFLLVLVGFVVCFSTLALCQYHEVINLPALEVVIQNDIDPETDEVYTTQRLCSTGIYSDPNDLSMVLVLGIVLSVYFLMDRRMGALRPLWLAPISLFGYALALTQSRGGLLALILASLALAHTRFGWKKTVVVAALVLPAVLASMKGRQSDFSSALGTGTGQARVQLWSEGIALFRQAPLFGIGQNEYHEEVGQVAHNSFVHCYTELGFFGGTIFFGAFFYAILALYRAGKPPVQIIDPELRRLRPYMLGLIAGYAAGMLSLSRSYVVPTYMILGLGAIYLHLAATNIPLPLAHFNSRLVQRISVASVVFIAMTYVYIRITARWG